jgi:uncharacterized membrane protein YuzA (DUF378 family)
MMAEKVVCYVVLALVLVGALNWGAHAAGMNLVTKLGEVLGSSAVETVVYTLVAVAAVVVIVQMARGKIVACPDSQ